MPSRNAQQFRDLGSHSRKRSGIVPRPAEKCPAEWDFIAYPLARVNEAYARMLSGQAQFRVVLTM